MTVEALTIAAGLVLALVFLVGRRWLRWRRLRRHISETLPPVIMDAITRPSALFSLVILDDPYSEWTQESAAEYKKWFEALHEDDDDD